MGAIGHDGLAVPGKVDLAHEPRFALGVLTVDPGTRQVSEAQNHQTVEPRVMQVLVALARARGAIVTRDELSDWCWDGRIVGEDALNRTLARIRRIAAEIGQGSFSIETITKVGYRLLEGPSPAALPEPNPEQIVRPRQIDRRGLIAGGALLAAAGAGAWRFGPSLFAARINPQAQILFERGVEANRQGWIETGDQAKSYFEQAVAIDPDFADAWGALALQMQTVDADGSGDVAVADRTRSAARRALALDSRQREARVALVMLPRWFGRWADRERAILALLDDYPDFPELTLHYARLLAQVARFDEAVAMQERTASNWPFAPEPPNQLIYSLCGAGRLVEAEARSENAMRRWPKHPGVWTTRMSLLTYSGRAETALALATDREKQPRGMDSSIPMIVATARALAYRRPGDIGAAAAGALQSVRTNIGNAPTAVRLFTALGDHDRCFALLDAYLFRRGPLASGAYPLTPYTQLFTDSLFHPYTRSLWPDPRFAALTREAGLDDYWRSASFVPAFRRA